MPARQQVSVGQHAVLVDNIGTYGRKISTASPTAQKFFDQGLRLVYGYYFPEAIASFEEAQQYDPDHPMLDWGLALAMGPNPNSRKNGFPDDPQADGRKAIAAARAHLTKATPVERALIEGLSVQYDIDRYPERAVRDEKYIEATSLVLDRYPDDLEAGFMYADALMIRGAWNYWQRDGSPLPGTREAVTVLEHLMALEPHHPGAVHLYVHLFESSAEPERALPQADRLESLMPKEGHMVHMPSHIYLRVGQYGKAIASNERSVAADRFFLSEWGDRPFPTEGTYHLSSKTHAPHAWHVLHFAAMLQGNYARALQGAREVDASHSMMTGNPRQQQLPAVWLVHKVFGKWQALLAEPAPATDRVYLDGAWHYFRGSAFVGLGELGKAKSELETLTATSRAFRHCGMSFTGPIPPRQFSAMLCRALSGEIAMAGGQSSEAVLCIRTSCAVPGHADFDGPPIGHDRCASTWEQRCSRQTRQGCRSCVSRRTSSFPRQRVGSVRIVAECSSPGPDRGGPSRSAERFDRAWKNADVVLSASVF